MKLDTPIQATLVQTQSEEQIRWGSNDNPNLILELDRPYEVSHFQMRSWHCKIELTEFPGKKFNTAGFTFTPDDVYQQVLVDARTEWEGRYHRV